MVKNWYFERKDKNPFIKYLLNGLISIQLHIDIRFYTIILYTLLQKSWNSFIFNIQYLYVDYR